MKGLSIEEKAKLYDKAITHARLLLKTIGNATLGNLVLKNEFKKMFPVLEESEDGKMKRIISDILLIDSDEIREILDTNNVLMQDIDAWLEKQCGQKPAELPKGEDYGIDGLYAAVDILKKTLGKVDGYQSDDGILEHKCAISAVKKLYEQNPWSEEDEKLLALSLNNLTELKDRFGEEYGRTGDCIEWLKSLKGRYTWKPSEIQLETLKELSHDVPTKRGIIEELLKQLKQL